MDHKTGLPFEINPGGRRLHRQYAPGGGLARAADLCAPSAQLQADSGIHDSGCSLKVYRRACFEGISLYGEMHRFIPAVLKIKGFRIGELEVNHRPRRAGTTKYTWKRGIKGLIDMVSVWFWHKYAVRPLHLLGGLGVVSVLLGLSTAAVGIGFYAAGLTLFRNVLPVAAIFFLLAGTQLFVFGLMADMMARQYFETTPDAAYSVAEVVRVEVAADATDGYRRNGHAHLQGVRS